MAMVLIEIDDSSDENGATVSVRAHSSPQVAADAKSLTPAQRLAYDFLAKVASDKDVEEIIASSPAGKKIKRDAEAKIRRKFKRELKA